MMEWARQPSRGARGFWGQMDQEMRVEYQG